MIDKEIVDLGFLGLVLVVVLLVLFAPTPLGEEGFVDASLSTNDLRGAAFKVDYKASCSYFKKTADPIVSVLGGEQVIESQPLPCNRRGTVELITSDSDEDSSVLIINGELRGAYSSNESLRLRFICRDCTEGLAGHLELSHMKTRMVLPE